MKHLSSIVLAAAVLAAGAVACFKDPTSSLRNGPSRILLTRSSVFINVGDSLQIQAEVKDEQGNTFDATDAAWTTSNAAIAVVNADTSKVIPYNAFSKAFIRTVAAGKAVVYFTSHGLTDSIAVVGVPLVFNGTITNATGNLRDTITINATSVLTFTASGADTSVVTVGGEPVFLVSRTANAIKFIGIPAAAKTVHITNLVLLGSIPLAGLDAVTKVTITNNDATEPANDSPATPAAMTLYKDYYGTVSGSDADDYVAFTTPATGDSVLVEVQWLSDADLDIGLLNGTGTACAPNPGACYAVMGTSANPEVGRFRLLAATTYQLDVWVYAAGSAPITLFRIRTTKLQ